MYLAGTESGMGAFMQDIAPERATGCCARSRQGQSLPGT
jgi:hypothetical protein